MPETNRIQQAIALIQTSRKIAILTGAGVSKESGVPTFRDAMDGLWAKYDPMQLATPQAFQKKPQLVWDWYKFRRELVRKAAPNPGHYALAQLEKRFPNTVIITQNVDDLHERAGSKNIIHLHGNLAQNKCFRNCRGNPTILDHAQIRDIETKSPPRCPYCGDRVRPDVVWFGEILPPEALAQAIRASQDADLMLVVGTSGLVTPAATMPEIARQNGARIIEVNPVDSSITPLADIKLDGASGDILPLLVNRVDS